MSEVRDERDRDRGRRVNLAIAARRPAVWRGAVADERCRPVCAMRWRPAIAGRILLTANFTTGRTGNQILAETRHEAEQAGIVSATYTHPVGFFGHAPGPTIGMWDNQGDTPGQGDWPCTR